MRKNDRSTKTHQPAPRRQALETRETKSSQSDLKDQHRLSELGRPQRGLVICRYNKEYEVVALTGEDHGRVYRCVSRANLGPVVTGDHVVWRAGPRLSGVIERREPRASVLERQDNFGRRKTIAANVDQMLVVIAVNPTPHAMLIDRYLAAAELMQIEAALVLNKTDLLNPKNTPQLEALLTEYRQLNYRVVNIVSAQHQDTQLSELEPLIKDKTSIVVGQSGVGKSSLVNALLPNAGLSVGALSCASGEGKHTTTQAKLFRLPQGGQLIDSPGIRDFGLWHVELDQLTNGYIEIQAAAQACRFRNCQHAEEPDCAVRAAVTAGDISPNRFRSFIETRTTLISQKR